MAGTWGRDYKLVAMLEFEKALQHYGSFLSIPKAWARKFPGDSHLQFAQSQNSCARLKRILLHRFNG